MILCVSTNCFPRLHYVFRKLFQHSVPDLCLIVQSIFVLELQFCLMRVSYYDELLFSTLTVAAAISLILAASRVRPQNKAWCTQAACYIALFAYPLVSVKVVGLWGCHEVDGQSYLRSDYALQCYDARWQAMAIYASFFLVIYVLGLPVFILLHLLRYSKTLKGQQQASDSLLLGFLIGKISPCAMWAFCYPCICR